MCLFLGIGRDKVIEFELDLNVYRLYVVVYDFFNINSFVFFLNRVVIVVVF